MIRDTTLFIVNYRFYTFDKRLALAVANALQEWSTSVESNVYSTSPVYITNFERLEDWLQMRAFNWLYSYVQAWYEIIDINNRFYSQLGWMRDSNKD